MPAHAASAVLRHLPSQGHRDVRSTAIDYAIGAHDLRPAPAAARNGDQLGNGPIPVCEHRSHRHQPGVPADLTLDGDLVLGDSGEFGNAGQGSLRGTLFPSAYLGGEAGYFLRYKSASAVLRKSSLREIIFGK